MKNKKQGFTLIELLVVIAIIGLLATLSVVALNNARERARDTRRVSDIRQIQTALELYYNANNDSYPTVAETTPTAPANLSTTVSLQSDLEDFLNPIPTAPLPQDGSCTNALGTSTILGNTYGYHSEDGSTYSIYYCIGEGQKEATPFSIGDL